MQNENMFSVCKTKICSAYAKRNYVQRMQNENMLRKSRNTENTYKTIAYVKCFHWRIDGVIICVEISVILTVCSLESPHRPI